MSFVVTFEFLFRLQVRIVCYFLKMSTKQWKMSHPMSIIEQISQDLSRVSNCNFCVFLWVYDVLCFYCKKLFIIRFSISK